MDNKIINNITEEKLYAASVRRLWAKKTFIVHLIVFVLTNGFFSLVNFGTVLNGITSGTDFAANPEIWFHWPIIAWFPILAVHGLVSYILCNFNAYTIQKEYNESIDISHLHR